MAKPNVPFGMGVGIVPASRREPCGNCPFRKSAPLAHWHPSEYVKLLDIQATEADFVNSRMFRCHKDASRADEDRELCVGWLLNQRERGIPSIKLRLYMVRHKEAADQYNEARGQSECYDSVEDVVRLNLERDRDLHPERYRRGRRG